jgi:hypothetical protein
MAPTKYSRRPFGSANGANPPCTPAKIGLGAGLQHSLEVALGELEPVAEQLLGQRGFAARHVQVRRAELGHAVQRVVSAVVFSRSARSSASSRSARG